ncbi:DUF885 domain-containing protein [Blastopirellula marina]|uniref:DUF885 domain-containing protein n=1 Tax=Blastopirellula marina TaxID=124 RepID=A0A2S8FEL8_9BACT|nr:MULTISPECIES: DUF885 domain-containing protein [Pirellulaceae]PQO30621.1 DUF885 domain-containing protein [Blastopirellula marina]RCS50758.1 DUF885 domain-containing protein [Bremerella cremea]
MSLLRLVAVALVTLAALPNSLFAQDSSAAAQLYQLFADDWQWRLDNFPTLGTSVGDPRGNDKWTDLSLAALEERDKHPHELLEKLRQIDSSQLTGQDLLSYELFDYNVRREIEGQKYPSELLAIDQLGGPQFDLAFTAEQMPFNTVKDYENYLARLNSYPQYLEQNTALLRKGIETRWVQPPGPLGSIPKQISGQVLADATDSPLFKPFQDFPDSISADEQDRLSKLGKAAIANRVFPAMLKLKTFIEDEYLPKGAEIIGAAALPDGRDYYAYRCRYSTTTDLTPQEIHEIGMSEVKRIRGEMEKVIRESGFDGSFEEFIHFLKTDPQFYYTEADDLLIGYRDIAKRVDAELPKLFVELPRLPYGVRAFPDYEAPNQTSARYYPGSVEAARAGFFMANTFALDSRPKYEMEALTLHEACPGHHLQIARAQELTDLPRFRRQGHYTAFVEGWALYAESLGEEMGFYQTPYDKFGQLTFEMWRACRLVVDTGMHNMGWSRAQAIKFFKENSGKSDLEVAVEIDRYIVWPGQALAYKIGELQIKQLRAKAEQELGDDFDLRKFHNAVLDNGAIPLPVLERLIDRWIAEQKTAKAS